MPLQPGSAFSWVMINTYLWVPREKPSFFHLFPNWLCSPLLCPWPQSLSGCWLSVPDLTCIPLASPPATSTCILWKRNLLLSETPVSQKCRSCRRKTGRYFLCCLVISFQRDGAQCNYSAEKSKSHCPSYAQEIQNHIQVLNIPSEQFWALCIGLGQHGQGLKGI